MKAAKGSGAAQRKESLFKNQRALARKYFYPLAPWWA
jgi:hypothetical protein